MSITVLNPTSGPAPKNMRLAKRGASLNGSVIGLIDNGKKNSDTVLNAVANRLKERFQVKEIIPFTKHSFSHQIKNSDAELFVRKCDFVLAGVGDWGSCSSGSLLDGVVMEKLNVPTAVINTEPFISSAKAMAVAHGIPDYPFAVIPHPIAATDKEVLEQWADEIIDEVVSILTAKDM